MKKADEIAAALRHDAPDGPLAELCAMLVDQVLAEPLSTYFEPARAAALIASAVGGPGLELALERHIRPVIERTLKRAEQNGEKIGHGLPADVAKTLEKMLAHPVDLDADMVRQAVNGETIRKMLATVVQEALMRVARGDLGSTAGAATGLVGLFGRGAGKLRDAGKGLLGGLGDELERQIQKRANDVLDASMTLLQQRLVEWMLSEETRQAIGKARAKGFRTLLERPVADARQLPIEALLRVVPATVRHNLGRADVQKAVLEELEAIVAIEGARPLRDILNDAGLLDSVRAEALGQALRASRTLVASEAFADWLARLVAG